MEEEGEEVEQGRSCHRCLLGTAGTMGEVEGAGLGGQQRSARKMEEAEGEAGDGDGDGGEEEEAAGGLLLWGAVEEAGLLEFPVWRAVVEEELRRGPWTEEGEEGLRGHLWTGEEEEEEVELSCGGAEEEEEGHRHGKEVVEVLQGGDKRHDQVTSHNSVNKVSQTAH